MKTLREFFTLTKADKFSAYMRLSMQAVFLLLVVMNFWFIEQWPSTPYSLAIVATAVVNTLLALLAVEKKSVAPIAVGINVLCWAITIGALAFRAHPQATAALGGLTASLLFSFAFVLAIRSKHPYLPVLLMGLVSAGVVKHFTESQPLYCLAVAFSLVLGSKMTIWSVDVVKELERTRELQSQLKVHEERLRFAQELHDSLGQHLAAMSLKTQLAITLQEKDPPRVTPELHELEKLVKVMRDDLHHVVTGYRTLNPDEELKAATDLLRGAGMAVTVHGSPQDIPSACRQIAAWFMREASTNILKHSQASEVSFHLSEQSVSVSNNGAIHEIGTLGGMHALQSRARAIHGTISLSHHKEQFTANLSWKEFET